MGTWYSKTEFSTDSLACSRWFNVTSFMGDIFAEQLAHDGIVDQQQAIFTDIQPPWERGELTIIRLWLAGQSPPLAPSRARCGESRSR